MGIDFDINTAPPDTQHIAAAREQMAAERQRLRGLNKRFLITIVTIVAIIFCFLVFVAIPYTDKPGSEGGIVFLIVYTIPYFFLSVFVIGNTLHHDKVEKPRKILETAEAALEEGEQKDISELLDACRTHAPLADYQRKVETQGRTLFNGELDAMRQWLEDNCAQLLQTDTRS